MEIEQVSNGYVVTVYDGEGGSTQFVCHMLETVVARVKEHFEPQELVYPEIKTPNQGGLLFNLNQERQGLPL